MVRDEAVARLAIQSHVDKIPDDNDVAIYNAVVLETLINKFLFATAGQGETKKPDGAAK